MYHAFFYMGSHSKIRAKEFMDEALSIAMHVMRASVHTTLLGSSPGSLVFNRDMFLNVPLIADWKAITMI
jgi:hypothetical protein